MRLHRLLLIIPIVLGLLSVVGPEANAQISIPNPINCDTAQCLITQVIRYVFGIIAVLATFMFIWGGLLMLTSAGNAQRVKQAKETLSYAAIGIVVILLSWSVIQFVIKGIR